MDHRPSSSRSRRLRRVGIIAGVALVHVGIFAALGLQRAQVTDVPILEPIQVELFRPFTPPPPPPPPKPPSAVEPGGGAPAAPSRVHVTPTPPDRPPELPVGPPTPAPETSVIVGASPTVTLNTGLGQGGQGTGTGFGAGEGDGPGAGTRPLILRGASSNDILAFVPPEARRQRRAGRAAVSCVVRADTRLEQCRVLEEIPSGFGFGEAAVGVAEAHFRVRPGTTGSGRVVEGGRMTVGVNFGRQ